MEKGLKYVKTAVIVVLAILVSIIAFVGLYVEKSGIWENTIPEFKFGMELKGFRQLRFSVDKETEEEKEIYVDENGNYKGVVVKDNSAPEVSLEGNSTTTIEKTNDTGYKTENRLIKVNPDENITMESFEKTKSIIQKRLASIESYEYNIRLDDVTGEIVAELPDDDYIVLEESLITTQGKIEIVDYQNGLLLLDSSNIKKAVALTSTANNQYQAYLQLTLDEFGTEKLKEISKNYVKTTNPNGTVEIKYIALTLDGERLTATYFVDELTNGTVQLAMGEATTDYDTFVDTMTRVENIVNMINNEPLPLKYELTSDNFIVSNINSNTVKQIVAIVICALMLVAVVVLSVKYKFEGFKLSVLAIAYLAVLTIALRYVKVIMTMNAILSVGLLVVINYLFVVKYLNEYKKTNDTVRSVRTAMKELYLAIIPVCIIAVIFTFIPNIVISSVGMTLFWGLLVQVVFDLIVLV